MYDVTVPVNHYRKDSRPVVGSFLNRLAHEGFTPTHVDDGEGWEKLSSSPFATAKEFVTAVDDSNVHFKHKSGGTLTVYFILVNAPEEIAADWWTYAAASALDPSRREWSVTRGEASEAMERAWSEFSRIWEGRDWPKKGGGNA